MKTEAIESKLKQMLSYDLRGGNTFFKKKNGKTLPFSRLVRVEGLEPPCLAASDPKSDTSANFATPACPRYPKPVYEKKHSGARK